MMGTHARHVETGPITLAELVLSAVETRILAIRALQRAGWREGHLSTNVVVALHIDVLAAAEMALS